MGLTLILTERVITPVERPSISVQPLLQAAGLEGFMKRQPSGEQNGMGGFGSGCEQCQTMLGVPVTRSLS